MMPRMLTSPDDAERAVRADEDHADDRREHADHQHRLPEREDRGEERHRREQTDEAGTRAVGELHGGHDGEQHEGRAEAGAGSWAQRATARRKSRHGYAQQHARSDASHCINLTRSLSRL